uniref:Uncharacterized protein n=1 Tax=Opuntia streptacantha TaxID=393608 RepID=A0A7C8YVI9_OPUST
MLTGSWNAFDQPTNQPSYCSNCYACTPLPPVKPLSVCKFLQKLNHGNLQNYGYSNDSKKQPVLQNPFKYVLLFELSGIELVEHLTEHKTVENQGVLDSVANTEDRVTLEL